MRSDWFRLLLLPLMLALGLGACASNAVQPGIVNTSSGPSGAYPSAGPYPGGSGPNASQPPAQGSVYASPGAGDTGRVVALDILEMPTLAGVEFIHGDFREDEVLARLEALLNGQPVDLVLSDMAPNMSGVDAVDLPRAMHLAELAMDFADRHLRPGGAFLIKLFQGVGFDAYVRALRARYDRVVIRKPAASRKRSPEVYALAQGKHPGSGA